MEINLEKEYADYIQNPVSEDEKQMAMNVGSVILTKVMSKHKVMVGLMGGTEMSEAEFCDPLVEIPDPKEGWLQRHRLYKNIYPAWRMIHKIHACKLPECAYKGEDDEDITTKTYKMLRYAQTKNMKVKSSMLEIDFYVTPDMTKEEVSLAPEIAFLNHGAEMEKIMAKDDLDVTGHTQIWAYQKKHNPKNAAYAERLGKMAQAEMKYANKPLDMQMFVRTATFQDQIRGDNGNHKDVVEILSLVWKYGVDFAKLVGSDAAQITRARKLCADTQKAQGELDI